MRERDHSQLRTCSHSRGYRPMRHYFAALLTTVSLGLASSGCSPSSVDGRYGLQGSVTFQGAPLKVGTIELSNDDQTQVTGATIADGSYSVPAAMGLKPGIYRVKISSVEDAPVDTSAPPGPETMNVVGKELIPAEFNVQTKLTAEVTEGGSNTFDFTIP